MDGEGCLRTENPRLILQADFVLILVSRQRQAPDDPIGLRYPIRVYQSGRSSIFPFSIFLNRFDETTQIRKKKM
jgi:hypothetical protein